MKKQIRFFIMAIALIGLAATAVFADAPAMTGDISKVTVYRGQALVTRTVNVDLPAGSSELVLTDLPAKIIPESLYAQTSGDVKVLSVRYREKAVRQDTREEVKHLEAQIEDVKLRQFHAKRDREHNSYLWRRFRDLWKLSADSANVDLNRSVMQSQQIMELAQYLEAKSIEWHRKVVELQDAEKDFDKELELLERKRKELDAGRSHTEREAVLFITSPGKKKTVVELNYLVNGANWLPQYNMRANPQDSNVLIEYNAVVNQTSGEDWKGVALSISTAEPTMVSAAPILDPMFVVLSQPVQILQPQQQVEAARRNWQSRGKNIQMGISANDVLNSLAMENQAFYLMADEKQLRDFQQKVAEILRVEGVSVTYDLPGKLTLPSRSDQQLVNIAAITAKADFTLVATPLLTDYVYLQAELLNDSDTVLLPGQASMFRNGEFVGKGGVPLVTIGEKFIAGFGINSQVQVAHELEDKKTRVQGGNRIDTYNYRITVKNYANTTLGLRLLDRLPYTDDSSIKVELVKTEPALSKDGEYLRTARKKGILRWDLQLEPNTIDQEATVVEYSYTMEYDRNMQIQPRRTDG